MCIGRGYGRDRQRLERAGQSKNVPAGLHRANQPPICWRKGEIQRPIMGGLDRHGILSTGSPDEVRKATLEALTQAPPNFILSADCTANRTISMEKLMTAIKTAHECRA